MSRPMWGRACRPHQKQRGRRSDPRAVNLRRMIPLLVLLLACGPAVRRIPPPSLPPAPRAAQPAGARSAWLVAAILREQGDLEGAAVALKRAVELDPDDPWLTLESARIDLARGRLAQADVSLAGLLGGPAGDEASVLRAAIAGLRGDAVQTEVLLTEAMTRDPDRWELWQNRLALLIEQGRDVEARNLVSAWSQRPLRGAQALSARGIARLQTGDPAGAVNDLGAAVALGASDEQTLYGLVRAARSSGHEAVALSWLARDPDATPQVDAARQTLSARPGTEKD